MGVVVTAVLVTAMTAVVAPVAAVTDGAQAQATADALATLEQVQAVRAGEASGDLTLLLRDLWVQRQALPAAQFAQATDEFGRTTGLTGIVETANFVIHYDANPGSSDHATDAFARETAQVFEEVLTNQTAQGWVRPADDGTRGGDNRIDVYLTDLGSDGIFGFAAPDKDAECDPCQRC